MYTTDYDVLDEKRTDSGGDVEFSGYADGDYIYEVYVDGEYWGGGTPTISNGYTTYEYFERSEAYEETTDITDKTDGDGSYFVGDTINIAPRVDNDGSVAKDVRVLIQVDTDGDGTKEINKTRGPREIDSGGSQWYGYDFVPDDAGSKEVRIIVQTKFGSGEDLRWVETGDTGWKYSISVQSNTGDVEIDVHDEYGFEADDTSVVLYDDNWNEIGERQADYGGTVSWNDLAPGSYNYEVYNSDGEFWGGGSVDVTRGETTTESFYRTEPYESGSNVIDAGDGDGTFVANQDVQLEVDVENDGNYARDVEVVFHLDTDDDGSAERSISEFGQVGGNTQERFTTTYNPDSSGDDAFWVSIKTAFDGDYTVTDVSGTLETYRIEPDTGDLTVEARDESGNTAGNVEVVLYDSNWNEIETKTTGSSGTVSWTNLATTDYRIEIYGPKGSFWAGGSATVSAAEETSTTLTRSESYETRTRVADAEGNGKHVVGEQVEIGPTVYNDAPAARSVRVKILVDTDNDGQAEVTKRRGPLTIDSGAEKGYGYIHTIESPGTKQIRVIVESEFTAENEVKWVQTDDTGWFKQFDAIADEGSTTVTVKDRTGDPVGDATVVLYDDNWNEIEKRSTDSTGDVTWSGLDTGTYHLEAYVDDDFWGGGTTTVAAGETTETDLRRKEPYEHETTISDKENNGRNIVGETVVISPAVYNDVSVGRDVRVHIAVDTDNDGTAEINKTRGPITIDGDSEGWFGYEHEITSSGTKQIRTIVETKYTVDGETRWQSTDDTGWTSSFSASADEGALSISVDDETGAAADGARVVVYDNNWSEIEQKTTDTAGAVTFSGLDTEPHHVEVYGENGSFWGGTRVEITATETTETTIQRHEPYAGDTVLTDVNNNGKNVVGELVRIEPRIDNVGGYGHDVRVRILVDTDNDGNADVEKLRGPLRINASSSRWYGYEHRIETAGSKQVRIVTETNFTTDSEQRWVKTDDTGWKHSFDAIKDEGTLSVTVVDEAGATKAATEVVLYDDNYSEIDTKQLGDDGAVSWSGLSHGNYHLEAYGPNGSFWGGSTAEVLAGETTTKRLERKEPHQTRTTLKDVTNGDGVFQVDETVLIAPDVANDVPVTKVVRTRIYVDTDDDGTAEVTKRRGPIEIAANSTGGFGYEHELETVGTKRVRVVVETKFTVEGETKWVQTDDTGWQTSFTARQSGSGLDVTVKNAEGQQVTGATVVLYNESWGQLSTQQSDLNGQAEWFDIDAGTYHLEVYGPGGAFWGGKRVEAEPGFVTETTVQRKEPYATQATATDTGDGDGVFTPGDPIALNTTVTTDSGEKPVRVKYLVDTDGDNTADRNITTESKTIGSGANHVISGSFTPETVGEKQIKLLVETEFTVDGETKWVVTDATDWVVTTDVVSAATDLKVTAQNADATRADDVTIIVYDGSGTEVTRQSVTDGVAYFEQLADGEYYIEVYGPGGFWNGQTVTVDGTATTASIRRQEPRVTDGNLASVGDGITVNESVTFEATVDNDQVETRTVRLLVEADTDGDGNSDTTFVRTESRAIDAGATEQLTANFEFNRSGTYWVRATVQTGIGGSWVRTDSTQWQSVGVERNGSGVGPSVDINVKPSDPVAGESVLFRADVVTDDDTEIDDWRWEFGDGSSATGSEVSQTYDSPGTRTVTLIVETVSGERYRTYRTISIAPRADDEFSVESVAPYVRGEKTTDLAVVEGTEVDVAYRATVSQPDETASVTFKLGNETYTDSDGSDGWTFPVNISDLTESKTLIVTATSTDGEVDQQATQIQIIEKPEWFDEFDVQNVVADEGVIVYRTEFPGDTSTSSTIPNEFPFSENVSMPGVGEEQSSTFTAYVIIKADLATTETDVTVEGEVEYELQAVTVDGEVGGTSYLDLAEGDFEGGDVHASAAATAEYPPPPTGIPSPLVGPIPPGVVSIYPIFEAEVETTGQFDEVDSVENDSVTLEYTSGTVSPRLEARQEIGKKWAGTELVIGFEEGIDTNFAMPGLSSMNGTVYGQMYARAVAYSFRGSVSYPSGEDRYEYTFGNVSQSASTAGTESLLETDTGSESMNWTVTDTTGESPPKPREETGGFGGGLEPFSQAFQPTRIVDTGTITDNTVTDSSPAVSGFDSGHAVVWSKQRPDRSSLNGRDIYISQAASGIEFDDPSAVTDDNYGDYDPDIAGAGTDNSLIVFTTFTNQFSEENTTKPSEMYPHGEIRVVSHRGSGWGSPTALTNNTEFDFTPVVAHHEGTYLIAWVSDSDNDLSTWTDRSVKYVRYDGEFGEIRSIDGSRAPTVSVTDDGEFKLAYLRMEENMTAGSVETRSIDTATGQTITTTSHDVDHLTDLAATGGTVAWVDASTPKTPLSVLQDGTVSSVQLKEEATVPQAIHLVTRNDRLLVNFRAHTPGSDVSRVFYKARVDGEWLSTRKYADGTASNLTFWQGDSASTESGFISVFAGKDLGSHQKHDLYGFQQRFRPDVTVTANVSTANGTVGDTATVNYTVSNTGDVPADNVTIALENASGEAKTTVVDRVPVGGNQSGTFNTTVDVSGRLSVVADPNNELTEFNESDNTATSVIVASDAAVTELTASEANETVVLSAELRNPSSVRLPEVDYVVRNGDAFTVTDSVGPLAPGESVVVNVTVPRSQLSASHPVEVRVNPNGTVVERNETNNDVSAQLLRPELGLSSGQINYYKQNGTTTATILIGNDGLGPANGTIRITNSTSGALLAKEDVRLAGSSATTSTTYTKVEIPLPNASTNDTLEVVVDAANETRPSDNVAVDEVELNTTLLPPDGDISVNATFAKVGNEITLTATNLRDPDGAVARTYWILPNGTRVMNESQLSWRPQTSGNATISLVVVDEDGLTTQTEVTVEAYTGPAPVSNEMEPPTDPDGDGFYEDVNGDGSVDIVDVQALFKHYGNVDSATAAFDFNRDGEVNIVDIQALYVDIHTEEESDDSD